jgi:hypothetical protein
MSNREHAEFLESQETTNILQAQQSHFPSWFTEKVRFIIIFKYFNCKYFLH